jgi:predicted HicB family RNase H-like nuclease
MQYKGFEGSVEYCSDSGVYYGQVLDVPALVNYESDAREDLGVAFKHAVDNYLDGSQKIFS